MEAQNVEDPVLEVLPILKDSGFPLNLQALILIQTKLRLHPPPFLATKPFIYKPQQEDLLLLRPINNHACSKVIFQHSLTISRDIIRCMEVSVTERCCSFDH
jgi:hypothetical protein